MAGEVLSCPKCGGPMRGYERNGVQIDQCTECRGIFLDRGELDRLIDAESSYAETPAAARPSTPWELLAPRGHSAEGRSREGHARDHSEGGQRRRRGWLGELFDG